MGRGDKKSKKGKIAIGSFGNSRRKRVVASAVAEKSASVATEKPKRTRTKKAE